MFNDHPKLSESSGLQCPGKDKPKYAASHRSLLNQQALHHRRMNKPGNLQSKEKLWQSETLKMMRHFWSVFRGGCSLKFWIGVCRPQLLTNPDPVDRRSRTSRCHGSHIFRSQQTVDSYFFSVVRKCKWPSPSRKIVGVQKFLLPW